MLYLIVKNKAMKITADNRQFDIPSIPQAGDYRYAKDLDCSCPGYEGFMERMDHWHFDGFYDSPVGLMVCFTCNKCGDKFRYHLRDGIDDYAALGVFDEYEIN